VSHRPHARPSRPCPDDGTLVVYLDGGLEPGARADVAAHVHDCVRCADRLAELEARSRGVGAWLARHEPTPPPREAYDLAARPRTASAPRRWAIAAGIVLAVGVVAGPARGWLLGRIGLAPDGPAASPPVATGETSTTSFVPAGDEVTVSFDAGATGRRLVVALGTDPLVTLRAPAPDVELLVRPDRVEVHDAHQPPRDYRLTVPDGVRRIRVRVPGARDVVLAPGPVGETRIVDVPPGSG